VELLVALHPEAGADAAQVDRLTRQLRNELRSLDVDAVRPVDRGAPPPGAKSGATASLTELLVTMSAGGGVFVTVIATIKDWLGRRAGGSKVTLTIDGDTLEIDSATPGERTELIETFLRRHQPA
jgi:Effector Associated Constant Component 1